MKIQRLNVQVLKVELPIILGTFYYSLYFWAGNLYIPPSRRHSVAFPRNFFGVQKSYASPTLTAPPVLRFPLPYLATDRIFCNRPTSCLPLIPWRENWSSKNIKLYEEQFSNLLTGFGESAIFVSQHKEGYYVSISKHCVFNEIGLVDPPTVTRLIRSR